MRWLSSTQRHDMRGGRERRIDGGGVAPVPVHADIARHLVGDLRRAGRARVGSRGDRPQRRPVDRDVLGGIERLGPRRGDDHARPARRRGAPCRWPAAAAAQRRTARRSAHWLQSWDASAAAHRLGHPRRSAPQARQASPGPPSCRSDRSAHARAASAAPPRAPAPSKRRSSRYAPWPVVKRASSRRLGVSPMMAQTCHKAFLSSQPGADRIP